jgi:RNA polymerase sigma-70 factor (ECF subfamily)
VTSREPIAEPQVVQAVEAVLAGQVDAYASIVRRFQDSIMTVAMGLLGDRQAAEELTQDAFVRAYERLRQFDPSRPMKAWLVKIAYCLAQDRWRGRAADSRHEQVAARQAPPRSAEGDPLESLITDERSGAL